MCVSPQVLLGPCGWLMSLLDKRCRRVGRRPTSSTNCLKCFHPGTIGTRLFLGVAMRCIQLSVCYYVVSVAVVCLFDLVDGTRRTTRA